MNPKLLAILALVAISATGCAADPAADPADPAADGETASADDADGPDDDDNPENIGTSEAALTGLKNHECDVHVMKPKIGHFGISAASNAWGRCRHAKHSSLHFLMMTKGILGWKKDWDFTQNVPDNGSFDLGGRQVSLAAVSEIYVEATVCWTGKIRHCRSDNAVLKNLL